MKLADVLAILGPSMRDSPLRAPDSLRVPQGAPEVVDPPPDAIPAVRAFVELLVREVDNRDSPDVQAPALIANAAAQLVHSASITESRRLLDPVLDTVPGARDLDPEVVRQLREQVMAEAPRTSERAATTASPAPSEPDLAQIEVAAIALYW